MLALERFVRDLGLPEDGRILFRGKEVHRPETGASADTGMEALAACVYTHFYTHPDGDVRAAFQNPQPDLSLIASFDAANAGRARHQTGWVLHMIQSNGAALAERHRVVGRFPAGQYLADPGSFPLRDGARLTVARPVGSSIVQPGFYHAFGENPLDAAEIPRLVRLYFNVRLARAGELLSLVTRTLNRYRLSFSFKINAIPDDYSRVDTAVLYLSERMLVPAWLALQSHRSALAACLDNAVPSFTLRIAPGVGLAENLAGDGSFGSARSMLVARALLAARQDERVDPARFDAAFDAALAAEGLDRSTLHLRARSRANYHVFPFLDRAGACHAA